MQLSELKGEKVGLCVSGGLDSRTIARKLVDLEIDLVCFSADLGQPDETDIADVARRMAPCGAPTVIVDLKQDMAQACLEVLRTQAMYDGGYWNSTGIARAVTVRGLLPELQKHGCTVLAHGATGRGNDQMRFERYTNVLAPHMQVYAPWRDPALLREFPGRAEMQRYLAGYGIETFGGSAKRYSTDANLAGLSHEAADLESLETPCTIVEPTMTVWPAQAPDRSETCRIRFEQGLPVAIDDRDMEPLAMMQEANRIAGRHGVGLKNALENRIVGTKSRGVYEAPGMELLGRALQQVYQAVLDRRATRLFRDMSAIVADGIYDGRVFDPVVKAAREAISSLARFASATVTLELYKGNLLFVALGDCPASLYNEADASMEVSEGLNPVSSQGYAEIQGVEAFALAKAGQIGAGW